MANATILQVGAWQTLTDLFIAHPNAPTNAILDLNDGVNWTLVDDGSGLGVGLAIDPPTPDLYKASNSRTVGERVTRRNYTKNRVIRARLLQIRQSTPALWSAALRTLIQLCEGVTLSQPAALKIQLTSGSAPVYADVVEAHVITQYKETLFAQSINDEVIVEFECRPFLRGPRQYASNLVTNPGFEAPSGPGSRVFADSFANTNAYNLGGSTSLGGNVLTLNASATAQFGSPEWGAVNQWLCRFEFFTGTSCTFFLHRDGSGNNFTQVVINGAAMAISQNVVGVFHTLINVSPVTLTNSTWYWMAFTQFPAGPGVKPFLQVQLFNDSAGSIGSAVTNGSAGPVQCVDATAGLSGPPLIFSNGGGMNIGGASNSNQVQLFGPGGWAFSSTDGTTGAASGAWEQNTANTYPGGPMTSYGAARIDVAPAGTLGALWVTYGGGSPTGGNAIPASPSQTLGVSAWLKSSGVSGTCAQTLQVLEFDVNSNLLRSGTVAAKTGTQAAWTQLSGSYTTGANCAYIGIRLEASDATAGASANGTIWFDNVQCWNQTTTGQTTMPYCELRFPQSPAQLLISGVLGDVPAPALLSVGVFFSSLSSGAIQTLRIGRRAVPTRGWLAVYNNTDTFTTPALNSAAYGGFTGAQTAVNTSGGLSALCSEQDLAGAYHLLAAASCSQSTANVIKNTVRLSGYLHQGLALSAALTGFNGSVLNAGFTTQNVVAIVDGGMYQIPFGGADPFMDASNMYEAMSLQYGDPTGSSTTTTSWLAYMPIDGGYLAAQFGISSAISLTNQWLWLYASGLAVQISKPASWRFSLESTAIPNPSNGVGGTGNTSSGYAFLNPAADAYLTLDPNAAVNGVDGVNQLLAQWNDPNGDPLGVATELEYVPLYLWPL